MIEPSEIAIFVGPLDPFGPRLEPGVNKVPSDIRDFLWNLHTLLHAHGGQAGLFLGARHVCGFTENSGPRCCGAADS